MRTNQRAWTGETTCRAEITNLGGAGLATFTWDFEDRLASIAYSDGFMGWGEAFEYNGLGTRISKDDSGGYREYMRNGAGVTSPVLSDDDAVYTPGISERRSSATRYYHADLKNGVTQVNTSQAIAATKQFDAFGNETSSSGTWNGPFGYGGPFGYQSDPDSGLKLLGHRYYDSSTGRFLTRDRAKDGRNWYVYCANNAVGFADPGGFRAFFVGGGGAFIVPLLSGSISGGIYYDPWTGEYALGATGGVGTGAGLTGGVGVGASYDHELEVGTGYSTGKAATFNVLPVTLEMFFDEGTITGGGLNLGPKTGAGAAIEQRWTVMIRPSDVSEAVSDGLENVRFVARLALHMLIRKVAR